MTKKPVPPRQTLSRALKLLLEHTKFTQPEVAKKAGVDTKTVNNMVNGRVGPSIDNVDAVARVFGLTGWQIILPQFVEAWLQDGKNLQRLMDVYVSTDETGRNSIMSVAEMAAKYSAQGTDDQ